MSAEPVLPSLVLSLPAMAVFLWLALFAFGILVVRVPAGLSWAVGKAQWVLKDGTEHGLKAVGYVAAIIVFAIAVALQTIFKV